MLIFQLQKYSVALSIFKYIMVENTKACFFINYEIKLDFFLGGTKNNEKLSSINI